jgi:hypothetical protein
MQEQKNYWFPARVYGWGWGFPDSWQGWVVWALFAVGIAANFYFLPPAANGLLHFAVVVGLTFALVIVCWLKGEPTRWHWGK